MESVRSNYEQHEVSYTNLFKCSPYLTTYLSQPLKYLTIFSIFQVAMVVYYSTTITKTSTALLIITILAHILTTSLLLCFPFVDPGIVPKILVNHEKA
jgi:hypothetical protein